MEKAESAAVSGSESQAGAARLDATRALNRRARDRQNACQQKRNRQWEQLCHQLFREQIMQTVLLAMERGGWIEADRIRHTGAALAEELERKNADMSARDRFLSEAAVLQSRWAPRGTGGGRGHVLPDPKFYFADWIKRLQRGRLFELDADELHFRRRYGRPPLPSHEARQFIAALRAALALEREDCSVPLARDFVRSSDLTEFGLMVLRQTGPRLFRIELPRIMGLTLEDCLETVDDDGEVRAGLAPRVLLLLEEVRWNLYQSTADWIVKLFETFNAMDEEGC